MSAVLKEAQAPADPLLQFLAADVPLRTLLEHGATRLDWLADLTTSPIVMTHPDDKGGMLVEEVTKLQLIERGFHFGFKPDEDGETDVFLWASHCIWQDEGDSPNRVPGIWFVHSDLIDENAGSWGAPVTIPSARLQELRRESAEHRAQLAQRQRAQDELSALWETASRHDRLLQSRIDGRLDRDGTSITREQASAEVEAIAAVHDVDLWSDDTLPPSPWNAEQKHEIARVMRVSCDIAAGTPLHDCKPLGRYVEEGSE